MVADKTGPERGDQGRPANVLGYARKPVQEEFDPERLINIRAPIVLLGAGMLIHFAVAWWHAAGGVLDAFGAVGMRLMVSTGIMLGCIYVASRIRGFKLGPLSQAIIKLMAISVAPNAVMMVVGLLFWFVPFIFILNLVLGFILYFALLGVFFDLDQDDTWYCICIIFVVNVAVMLMWH